MPTVVASAQGPRGSLRLTLRDDDALELRVNGVFVMDTLETSSEEALADASLAAAESVGSVLIGGLGLGYTLRSVLADPRVGQVVVVEIEGPLIEWLRTGVVPHGPGLVDDERVRVVHGDVAEVVAGSADSAYDVVLLDTDNGPGNLVHASNQRLYQPGFLSDVHRVLSPGGTVTVWSSHRSLDLGKALGEVFENTGEIECPVVLQERRETYWLYTGTRAAQYQP